MSTEIHQKHTRGHCITPWSSCIHPSASMTKHEQCKQWFFLLHQKDLECAFSEDRTENRIRSYPENHRWLCRSQAIHNKEHKMTVDRIRSDIYSSCMILLEPCVWHAQKGDFVSRRSTRCGLISRTANRYRYQTGTQTNYQYILAHARVLHDILIVLHLGHAYCLQDFMIMQFEVVFARVPRRSHVLMSMWCLM